MSKKCHKNGLQFFGKKLKNSPQMVGFQMADNKGVRSILFFPSSSSLRHLPAHAAERGRGGLKKRAADLNEVRPQGRVCFGVCQQDDEKNFLPAEQDW